MSKKNTPKHAPKNKERLRQSGDTSYHIYIILFCVLCTIAIYFSSAVNNQFTNWDDNNVVTENQVIKSWSSEILTAKVNANWAPVCQFALAVQYQLFELNPAGYHFTSLLLHLCNIVLVFLFIFKLSKKYITAGIVALFFGIHPMHVEPVVWVTSQKDLLFTLFYLCAMLMYIKYKEHKNHSDYSGKMYLAFVMVFFVLSCLSKGMGETLPIALVLIDCFQENDWRVEFIIRSAVNKIVFFIISVAFGITAYNALHEAGALDIVMEHTFAQQIMFVCYGLIMYVVNFFTGFFPSPLYLYPLKNAEGTYPVIYYLSPVILVVSTVLLWIFVASRKKEKRSNNILYFGILFFLTNIFLVLQLKTLTYVIMAERYTYLSYVGFLFIAADVFNSYWEKYFQQYKGVLLAGLCSITVLYSVAAYNYTSVWHDSISLWTHALDRLGPNPAAKISVAYNNRGLAYTEQKKFDLAFADYTLAISLDSGHIFAYNNRGLLYAKAGNQDLALADYNKAIILDPVYFAPYYNRGLIYAKQGKTALAITDYSTAIKLNPNYTDAYNDRGLAYARQEKFDLAIADYNKAINLNALFDLPYYNRGLAYAKTGKADLAVTDFSTLINWNGQDADAYNERGLAYAQQGKFSEAIADYKTAIRLQPQFSAAHENLKKAEEMQGNFPLK